MNDTIQKQNDFEQQYLSLRSKEGRLYADQVVAKLPAIPNDHSLKKEWDIRRNSGKRLIRYLSRKQKPLDILEVGCGNGWLCNQLSHISGSKVIGSDINKIELEQAQRIFPKSNLQFVHGSIDSLNDSIGHEFDIIIFAASFQYFKAVKETLGSCFDLLKNGGEIHIIDTKFYSLDESIVAQKRSRHYFTLAGFPAMEEYYFHHTLAELESFNYKIMFNPETFINALLKRNPFPWICLTK